MPEDNPVPDVLIINGNFYELITGYNNKLLPPKERARRKRDYQRYYQREYYKTHPRKSYSKSQSVSKKRKASDDAGNDQKKHKNNNSVK